MKGKILMAMERCTVSQVKGVNPLAPDRRTGVRDTLTPGTLVLCVQHILPKPDWQGPSSGSKTPYIHVVNNDLIWEGNPHNFSVVEPSEKLTGKSFCFTGQLPHAREYYMALIKLHEGTYLTGVSRDLSYLVIADPKSKSTKAVKARNYGTPMISEQELMEMIER